MRRVYMPTTTDNYRPEPGATEIPVTLAKAGEGDTGDDVLVLRPTYGAAKAISNQFGGITPAIEKVLKLDTEAIATILAYGLGYYSPTKRPPKDLPERVWKTGMTDDEGRLAEMCVIFLRAISNGGRVPKDLEGLEGTEVGKSTDDPLPRLSQ